jgi:hypothetical protein
MREVQVFILFQPMKVIMQYFLMRFFSDFLPFKLNHVTALSKAVMIYSLFYLSIQAQAEPKVEQPEQSSVVAQKKPPGVYYTGDKVPGDPKNGETILKRIYACFQTYLRLHQGKYPDQPFGLTTDVFARPAEYGFVDFSDVSKHLINPDNQFDDNPLIRRRPQQKITIAVIDKRPDGQLTGSAKPPGTRDVLAYTSTYYHKNGFPFKKSDRIGNPVGFYMVLWDDGEIERIDYDRVGFAFTTEGMHTVFPKQAGVPATTISYQEFWLVYSGGVKKLPIGYPLPDEQAEPMADNGAIESVVALTRLLNKNVRRPDVWQAFNHQVKEFNSQEVITAADKLGVNLVAQRLNLSALEQKGCPAVLFLQDSLRFVALSSLTSDYALVVDDGMTLLVTRDILEKRYSGEVLLPEKVEHAIASLRAESGLRVIPVKSMQESSSQQVILKNTGATPLNLFIEYPLPGVAQAELSSSTVPPGGTVTLTAKLVWREVLKSVHQDVYIVVRSNDPLRPRLQLAFRLVLTSARN